MERKWPSQGTGTVPIYCIRTLSFPTRDRNVRTRESLGHLLLAEAVSAWVGAVGGPVVLVVAATATVHRQRVRRRAIYNAQAGNK